MRALSLSVVSESWPLAEVFTISRGSKSTAEVIVVTITETATGKFGRGEAVPYARYGESCDSVMAEIAIAKRELETGCDPTNVLQPGAALNAVDCALWDLTAKLTGQSAAARAGVTQLAPVLTAYTLSLAAPDVMAAKARNLAHLPLLKLKLGGDGDSTGEIDAARMHAVRTARPDARLIADANEAWTIQTLDRLLQCAADLGFETVEQPLPANADHALATCTRPIAITADESVHTAADIQRLAGLYDAVNIKLDKAGGLTGALALCAAARNAKMKIMVGSMVATSLAIAPALILAQSAEWTDLDGPLLLARDRDHGVIIRDGVISPADARRWG